MKKLRSKRGFTLAETLLAILILLLVSTIVANGVPVAQKVYNKVVLASNAQAALSTAVTALRDELGTAWDVEVAADGRSVTYFSADTGGWAKIYLVDDTDELYLLEYAAIAGFNESTYSKGDGSYEHALAKTDANMYVSCAGIARNGDELVLSGVAIDKKSDDSMLTSLEEDMVIRPFSFTTDPPAEPEEP